MLKSITCACRSQVYRNSFIQLAILERFTVHRRTFFLLSHNCLLNNKTRNSVEKCKSNQIDQPESFVRFWERHRQHFIRRSKVISKWTEALQCDKEEVTRLVENDTELFERNLDRTLKKAELLMAEGISSNTILNNLWVLRISESRLQTYMRAMHLWGMEERYFDDFVLVLDVDPKEFFLISESIIRNKNNCPHGNRVLYLANELECSVSDVLSRMLRKKFLFMRPLNSINELLDLYREFGIKNADILSDLSCLGANIEPVRERLEELREIGYHPMKPWLARYQYNKFRRAINFFLAEKEVTVYNSREGFLAAKMTVDVEKMIELKDHIQRKYPYFFKIRALTFMKKLKFLLSEGYPPEELLSSPYAFYPRISTLKNRIITLQKLGVEKPRLPQVTKSAEAFQQFLDALLASQRLKCESDINKHSDFVTSSDYEKNP